MFIRRAAFIFSVVLLSSCNYVKSGSDHIQMVRDYFEALNESNFERAADLLSPNIMMLESDIEQVNGKEDWHRQFQWDSVFSPTYEIIKINEAGNQVEVTVLKICDRIRFLQDEPIVFKEIFGFEGDKISSEKTYKYLVFDEIKWQSRRDTLVAWIDKNHPGLSGFIHDQTIRGGQNYLKAIELYESKD